MESVIEQLKVKPIIDDDDEKKEYKIFIRKDSKKPLELVDARDSTFDRKQLMSFGVLNQNQKATQNKKIRIRKRVQDVPPVGEYVIAEGDAESTVIEKMEVLNQKRFNPENLMKADEFYLNNKQMFINFMDSQLLPYRNKIKKKKLSCKDRDKASEFELLPHQNIVREYMNVNTPYRGLLLFHGLGSGKTCSSIAISEGLKTSRKVMVMTPASLRVNYVEELKSCGDIFYKKQQHWKFIKMTQADSAPKMIQELAAIFELDMPFVQTQGGIWIIDENQPSNFDSLTSQEQKSLEKQIHKLIALKYDFIHYNGLRNASLDKLTVNGTINPFDNRVVIVDEAHNFVSRIVNKMKKKNSIAYKLYILLLTSVNTKIIFLTGTPIISIN